MDLWLFQHLRYCGLVKGMHQLVDKNHARYVSDHFFAWRGVVENYFRREIIVQQSAIRRAYLMASVVFKSWKLLEDSIPFVDSGRLDTVLIRQMVIEKQMTTKSFQSLKASLAVAVLQKKTADILQRKAIASTYCMRAYHAWKEDKEFSRFGERVLLIFERRFFLRLFQTWKLAYRICRKFVVLSTLWKERFLDTYFSTWRDRTRKYKKVL